MRTGYKLRMLGCQSSKLPKIWLMTDPRFGDRLLASIQKLPMGSGVVLRHYDDAQRTEIYKKIAKICRRRGHRLIIAGAHDWHSDGQYCGRPDGVSGKRRKGMSIIGVHNVREIQCAKHMQPNLYFLSPIFATNSHKGQRSLGISRFRQLSMLCDAPVLALGGMDVKRSRMIKYAHGYAAIDGLIA